MMGFVYDDVLFLRQVAEDNRKTGLRARADHLLAIADTIERDLRAGDDAAQAWIDAEEAARTPQQRLADANMQREMDE